MNKRSRNWALELYPEDDSHCKILDYILSYFDYAYILHDKDIFDKDIYDDDKKTIIHKAGELKKPHWHVILSFKNSRSEKSLKDELGLKHIESCNFYAYSRYLIHKDSPNKYQYDASQIKTNIQLRIDNALSRNYNQSEQDTRILLNYIFNNTKNSYLTFRMLTEYAIENDCLLELKRNTYFYKQFCDDFGYKRF